MPEHVVKSPLPGVFYRRPAPEEPAFVEEGAEVTQGQTIGLVEVMKQFAEVKADAGGTLVSFAVENEATVGPGDDIATIETA